MIIPIPLAVVDNSQKVTDYAFMRYRSPGRGIVTAEERDRDIQAVDRWLRGYSHYQWFDTNPDDQRCRFDMITDPDGKVTHLFHTEYFTRVGCVTHEAHYADAYASVTDENGVTTLAQPYCDECVHHLRRSAEESGMTLNLSETLLIGQHDD